MNLSTLKGTSLSISILSNSAVHVLNGALSEQADCWSTSAAACYFCAGEEKHAVIRTYKRLHGQILYSTVMTLAPMESACSISNASTKQHPLLFGKQWRKEHTLRNSLARWEERRGEEGRRGPGDRKGGEGRVWCDSTTRGCGVRVGSCRD